MNASQRRATAGEDGFVGAGVDDISYEYRREGETPFCFTFFHFLFVLWYSFGFFRERNFSLYTREKSRQSGALAYAQ